MGKAGGAKTKAESVVSRRVRDLERQVENMQAIMVQSAERPKPLPGVISVCWLSAAGNAGRRSDRG